MRFRRTRPHRRCRRSPRLGMLWRFAVCSLFVTIAWAAEPEVKTQTEDFTLAQDQDTSGTLSSSWRWTYALRNRTGYRRERPRVFQMSRTTADIKGIGRLSERWRLTMEGRAHYDPVGRLGYPKTLWFDPRQFLLDGRAGPLSLSLGLQQVVWGQADGLRVLDVINPLDYREFILEDFLDARRPLWTARADMPFIKGSSLQLIWVPYFAPGRVPGPANEFGFGAAFGLGVINPFASGSARPPVTIIPQPVRRPPYRLGASQVGARWSQNLRGWDLTANGFHGWEDVATPDVRFLAIAGPPSPPGRESPGARTESANGFPAFRQDMFPGGVFAPDQGEAPGLGATPTTIVAGLGGHYDRKTVFGATAANSLGPLVLRAEAGWTAHRPTAVRTFPATPPFQRFGQFAGVVGLDYSVRPWLWTSGQYFLQFTSAPQSVVYLPRNAHLISYHVRAEFLRDTLRAELFVLAGLNQRQSLVRPRLTRLFGDHWTIALGADFFGGRSNSLLGYFATRDRAVLELKWAP